MSALPEVMGLPLGHGRRGRGMTRALPRGMLGAMPWGAGKSRGLSSTMPRGLPSPISGQEQYKGVQEQCKEAYRKGKWPNRIGGQEQHSEACQVQS